LRPAQNIFTLN